MTSRFLWGRADVVSGLVQSRGADEFARSCSSDHEEGHEDGDMCEKRQQEASSCRLLLPRQSKLSLCIVRLTVFRAKVVKSTGTGSIRRGEGDRSWDGLRGVIRSMHRWPDVLNRTQRWPLLSGIRRARWSGTKLNPDELTWQFHARLSGRNWPGNITVHRVYWLYGSRVVTWPVLPTYGRPGALLIQKKGIGQKTHRGEREGGLQHREEPDAGSEGGARAYKE